MRLGDGQGVIITGASRGIGRAMAAGFAARGCRLGLVARSGSELEQVASSLAGDGHEALPADVGDAQALTAAVERFGDCHVAVANAGIADYGPFRSMSLDLVERMTRINWLGTVHTVGAVLPAMVERAAGSLVVVSSGAGYRAFPEAAVYGATKAAQRAFAEALRHELAATGVSVTIVYPGEISTHLHAHERDRMPAWYRADDAADPRELARRVVAAVERGRRTVHYPPAVRALGTAHGISPRLGDAVLRALRGRSAAPAAWR